MCEGEGASGGKDANLFCLRLSTSNDGKVKKALVTNKQPSNLWSCKGGIVYGMANTLDSQHQAEKDDRLRKAGSSDTCQAADRAGFYSPVQCLKPCRESEA